MAGIVHAAQQEQLGLERREAVAYVEGIDRFQVVVLGQWAHPAVPLHQLLAQSGFHELQGAADTPATLRRPSDPPRRAAASRTRPRRVSWAARRRSSTPGPSPRPDSRGRIAAKSMRPACNRSARGPLL